MSEGMKRAQTIQIYLPHGEPRGIRIAEITTRTLYAIHVPRSALPATKDVAELGQVGVYFLIGESEGPDWGSVYIGQSENCQTRLRRHFAEKPFWTDAVVVISPMHKFTATHVKCLEHRCITAARAAGRYTLDNKDSGCETHVPRTMQAEIEDALDVISILTGTLGFPIVEQRGVVTPSEVYAISAKKGGQDARMQVVDDGFRILAGSTIAPDLRPSAQAWIASLRDELLASGKLTSSPEGLRFVQPHDFRSPSAAASMVFGGNTNGWDAWKLSDGRTLAQVRRGEEDDAAAS